MKFSKDVKSYVGVLLGCVKGLRNMSGHGNPKLFPQVDTPPQRGIHVWPSFHDKTTTTHNRELHNRVHAHHVSWNDMWSPDTGTLL